MLQTTHITSKHAPQQRSDFGLVCLPVSVCVCLLVVMLSVFSMKHSLSVLNKHSSAGQLRSALTALFHLEFAMCSNDIHARVHTHTHAQSRLPLSTPALWGCAEKTFHQTLSKRKYFSPRGEQQGLRKLILI